MCHTCMQDDEPWWISNSVLRKYGGPPIDWTGPPPPRGCEVFVGKLPRDVTEEKLVSVLSRVGLIYELRLMVDFSGANRGYCFAVYSSPSEAKRACQELNNMEISNGKNIGVVMSVDNRRLFVGGLPRDKTRSQVKTELDRLTEGILDVILYPSANDKSKNRGFAFIEYETHKEAAHARKQLNQERITLWGYTICVDWAEPEQDVDPETMNNVKILYVRNLMLSTTEEEIRHGFQNNRLGVVERVKKMKDYAFVHFTDRSFALEAMERMNGTNFYGSQIEVMLAKPPDRSITRYVKTVQKMGPNALLPAPSLHHSLISAATQLYASQNDYLNNISHKISMSTSSESNGPSTPRSPYAASLLGNNNNNNNNDSGHHIFQSNLLNSLPTANHIQTPLLYNQPHLLPIMPPSVTVPLNPATLDPLVYATGVPLIDAPFHPSSVYHKDLSSTRVPRGAAGSRSAGFQALVNSHMRRGRKRLTEHLEDHCMKRGFGQPIFEPVTFLAKDDYGRNVYLYTFKVTILGLNRTYQSPLEPCPDPEWAREYTAAYILSELLANDVH